VEGKSLTPRVRNLQGRGGGKLFRKRDSNPRVSFSTNGFQDRRGALKNRTRITTIESSLLWLRVGTCVYALGLVHSILVVFPPGKGRIRGALAVFRVGVVLHAVAIVDLSMPAGVLMIRWLLWAGPWVGARVRGV